MQRAILSIFSILSLDSLIHSSPINKGFSLKFNAPHSKEDLKTKQSLEFVANSSQDLEAVISTKQRILSKTRYTPSLNFGIGCTNQIAQIVVPVQYRPLNESKVNSTNSKVLHLPMVDHPYKDYKILVATAPAHMKLGRNPNERLLVYIVFPDDRGEAGEAGEAGDDAAGTFSVPTVYFVNQTSSKMFSAKRQREPIFIVDNNRTVTKLHSKRISKFVKFKNKLSDHLMTK